jgi:Na+/H+ antiporter NhaD/arsenite permease-like protein
MGNLVFFYSVIMAVGGSLLSIGSAAGVALMGHARGYYTFFVHLKWTPAIALGYFFQYLCSLFTEWLARGSTDKTIRPRSLYGSFLDFYQ